MFPKLESLHLDTVGEWKGFKPEQLADLPKPPHLEVLRLEGCNQHVFNGILSWLNQLPESRLREIAFNETIKENTFNLTLYDFLQRTAPTLEQVRMDLVKYHTFERDMSIQAELPHGLALFIISNLSITIHQAILDQHSQPPDHRIQQHPSRTHSTKIHRVSS